MIFSLYENNVLNSTKIFPFSSIFLEYSVKKVTHVELKKKKLKFVSGYTPDAGRRTMTKIRL